MKQRLKSILPAIVFRWVHWFKYAFAFRLLVWGDFRRFAKQYSRNWLAGDDRNLQAHLIFHAHAVEKGLSHSDIRYGFGVASIGNLIQVMERFSGLGYAKESAAYQMALSALNEYLRLHEALSVYQTPLRDAPHWLLAEIRACSSDIGGVDLLERVDWDPSVTDGFKAVVFGRRSVREFESGGVSGERIRDAIEVASRAPSVCNRQSVRVRVIRSPSLIGKVLQIQGGLGGYPSPPVVLVVTADARDYIDGTERNQPFIDGGLFSMGLLLGLEAGNLAACALNAMFSSVQERSFRVALDLSDSEIPIMLIAVGGFPGTYRVPKSFRYDVDVLSC